MNGRRSRTPAFALAMIALSCALLVSGRLDEAASQPKPEGEMRWALYVTLFPLWLDPGEVVGNPMAPSLAEPWDGQRGLPRHH